MKKERLINKRIERGLSQQEVAYLLNMEQSTYSRRENGQTKISQEEWLKHTEILECKLNEIFESNSNDFIQIDNSNANFHDQSGNNNHYYSIPVSIIENLQDYIKHLQEENQTLKSKFNS